MNYYNEWDKPTAAWLQELMERGLIPKGHIDTRSIADVQPSDLAGYVQCHFFAGIGGWPLALDLAGWPRDRPVWTGSCPCQPFSAAGKQKGGADDRHIWPEMFRLARECRPDSILGEQVEGAVGHGWLDGVFGDLEGEGYTCGAAVLGAHSAGAPHIRQRLYWVADGGREHSAGRRSIGDMADPARVVEIEAQERQWLRNAVDYRGADGGIRNAFDSGPQGYRRPRELTVSKGWKRTERYCAAPVCAGGVSNAAGLQSGQSRDTGSTQGTRIQSGRDSGGRSFWSDFDILPFIDGKARRVESGAFPLVAGLPRGVVPSCDISESYAQATSEARVMRLKGYGNAIVPQVAAEFIGAYMDITN